MRIRKVRRLQEAARWVTEAPQAMLFIPWTSHLNLSDRLRQQSLVYWRSIGMGVLLNLRERLQQQRKTEAEADREVREATD